jgi:UDP-glucose:(heptosyl)LPS alpha-1,3-glucosyltransferase
MMGSQRVNNVVLLQGEGDCVPCLDEGCERHIASLSDCLQQIPATSVIAAIKDLSNKASDYVANPDTPRHPRRKIAVVVPKYGLVGGGERFASEVTERLARNKNFEIHVFANRWVAQSGRINFHKIPKLSFPRFLGPLYFAWFVKRKIKRMNFDLVHSHHWIFNADIFSAHGVPHVGWVRDVRKKNPSLYDRAVIGIEQRLMKGNGSTCFLPVSSIAMEEFKREYRTLSGKWQIVHPGVDVARFSSPERDACRAEIRSRYGIGADDLLLLFVGMNFEVKGLDAIIVAVAKAREARPDANIKLLVVGRGDKRKYGKIAESLGISQAVVFAGTQHAGLERYYRAADAFTLFSAYDTFGMVVLEAMAAGLPVIVSPNVGAKDLVQDGVNGYILPTPYDVDAAADFIVQLINKEKREAMGAAAAQTASMHDWQKLAEKMEQLYLEILASKISASKE